ncbi:hypothetical protein [Pantoea sp. At-9b]|jgi:hypothetical protein|uniref:hypothetical protein n=1 Tax=Pantoea sp. (strain At-9b) TaxID=592316 RepID=UPI0001B401EF|nr:hypothetical protein [Pantoea sp. At-9b]ADU72701.1 hypothetical protein Pat9b_4137 [Pantoea sp. At-9b]
MGISQAKLITLRRMQSGTKHRLRGDKAIGLEMKCDFEIEVRKRRDITCRSLASLMRSGLIEFIASPTDMSRYYEVRLTEEGEKVVNDNR